MEVVQNIINNGERRLGGPLECMIHRKKVRWDRFCCTWAKKHIHGYEIKTRSYDTTRQGHTNKSFVRELGHGHAGDASNVEFILYIVVCYESV